MRAKKYLLLIDIFFFLIESDFLLRVSLLLSFAGEESSQADIFSCNCFIPVEQFETSKFKIEEWSWEVPFF